MGVVLQWIMTFCCAVLFQGRTLIIVLQHKMERCFGILRFRPRAAKTRVLRMSQQAASLAFLDHVLNSNHDNIAHAAVFAAAEGNLFCVHCAAERYDSAPNFRRLALLDGVSCILRAHGPRSLSSSIGACLPMLLHGIDSAEADIARAATDILLTLKSELPHPIDVLASLVSRTMSLGLPRASGHLFAIGQLLSDASQDHALATTLADACMAEAAPSAALGRGVMTGSGTGGHPIAFGGFASFLATHAASASLADHLKSDVVYVAMELLDCCLAVGLDSGRTCLQDSSVDLRHTHSRSSVQSSDEDPFVSLMLAVPRLLSRRSSCDEPLQLHTVAYVAMATTYCRQRTDTGVPGWEVNGAGIPVSFVALFDGGCSYGTGKHQSLTTSVAKSSSNAGLCDAMKALLMSSSYRVRTATARLVTALCGGGGHQRLEHGNDNGGRHKIAYVADENTERLLLVGEFFRERFIASGATDFIFEAIKKEEEGSLLYYLEAAEALSLSPVDFFHAGNFCMKAAAPILLAAARGGMEGAADQLGGAVPLLAIREACRGGAVESYDHDHNKSYVFAVASRLLLKAMVTVPPASVVGVVEELLNATAAYGQSCIGRDRSIGVAADLLSLMVAGDIPYPKSPWSLIEALRLLLERIEDTLQNAAQATSEHAASMPSKPSSSKEETFTRSHDLQAQNLKLSSEVQVGEESDASGNVMLQVSRIMGSLMYMAERWILSGYPGFSAKRPVGDARGTSSATNGTGHQDNAVPLEEPGVVLVELVFGCYERTLANQHELTAQSDSLAHGIAFASCVGAAIDSATAVLKSYEKKVMRKSDKGVPVANAKAFRVGSSDARVPSDASPTPMAPWRQGSGRREGDGRRPHLDRKTSERGYQSGGQQTQAARGRQLEILITKTEAGSEDGREANCASAADTAVASCLESILTRAVASDLLGSLLDLYTRCCGQDSPSAVALTAESKAKDVQNRECVRSCSKSPATDPFETSEVPAAVSKRPRSDRQMSTGSDCSSETKELLTEILQSLLYAQGWASGLCCDDIDRPFHMQHRDSDTVDMSCRGNDEHDEDGPLASSSETKVSSALPATVRLVLSSWAYHDLHPAVPLDHHILSRLGTSEDNGGLCKIALLLISLSPSYLGVLHPHLGCRADTAITLLRFVKVLPEAMFCLNLFSHIAATSTLSSCNGSGGSGDWRINSDLQVAVAGLLSRFPTENVAFARIPLSPAAVSFVLRTGCMAFMADWLVAAKFDRIKDILCDLGLPLDDSAPVYPSSRAAEDIAEIDATSTTVSLPFRCFASERRGVPLGYIESYGHQATLTGVLQTAITRWRCDLRLTSNNHQRRADHAEITISRLCAVLLLAPDAFCVLAWKSPMHDAVVAASTGGGVGCREGDVLADSLAIVISETLTRMASSWSRSSMFLSGAEASASSARSSKARCTSQVLQLASAFLHARCGHRYYCPPSGGDRDFCLRLTDWTPDATAMLEVTLAYGCSRMLQNMLAPERKRTRGSGGDDDGALIYDTYLHVFNLLNTLLLTFSEDTYHEETTRCHKQRESIATAVEELQIFLTDRAAFATAVRVQEWIDHAPETLAAYLQFCVLWNTFGAAASSTSSTNIVDHASFGRLKPPFDLLDRLLMSGDERSVCHTDGHATSRPNQATTPTLKAGMAGPVLHALAARCVESIAPRRPFSRPQVLSLQLALQGIACDGDVTTASTALHAICALWRAYSGVLRPMDLVDQPWNSFVAEYCLEKARWSLSIFTEVSEDDADERYGNGGQFAGGTTWSGTCKNPSAEKALLDGDGCNTDPIVLISAVAALAELGCRSSTHAGHRQGRQLKGSVAWSSAHQQGGSELGAVMTPPATATLYECVALLTEHLRRSVGASDDADSTEVHETNGSDEHQTSPTYSSCPLNDKNGVSENSGGRDTPSRPSLATVADSWRWDAFEQLVHMLLRILLARGKEERPFDPRVFPRVDDHDILEARRTAIEALLALQNIIETPVSHSCSTGSMDGTADGGIRTRRDFLLSAPLSRGTYYLKGNGRSTAANSQGVLLLKPRLWLLLCPPPPFLSNSVSTRDNEQHLRRDLATAPPVELVVAIKQLVNELSTVGCSDRRGHPTRAHEQNCGND